MSAFSCQFCEDRQVGCHSSCEKYKVERQLLDEKNAVENRRKKIEADYYNYKRDKEDRLTRHYKHATSAAYFKRRLGR